MKITKVKGQNVKGSNFEHDLKGFNLIVGANGSGKTAILEAIIVGCLGYLPKLGRRNSDTFKLSSAAGMSIEIENDDGKSNSYVLQRSGSGSVKCKKDVGFEVEPDMINIDEFLSMSQNKRVDYMFRKAGVEVSPNEIKAAIGITSTNKAVQCEIETIMHLVDVAFSRGSGATSDALNEIDDEIKESIKILRSECKLKDKTVEGLVDLAPEPPSNFAKKLNDINCEGIDIAEKLGAAQEEQRKCHSDIQEANEMQESIDMEDANGDFDIDLDAIKEGIAKGKEAERLNKEGVEALGPIRDKTICLSEEVRHGKQTSEKGKATLRELEGQLSEAQNMGKCPTCGADGVEWKEKTISDINVKIEGLKNVLAVEESVLQRDMAALEDARRDYIVQESHCESFHKDMELLPGFLEAHAAVTAKDNERSKQIEARVLELRSSSGRIPELSELISNLQSELKRIEIEQTDLEQKQREYFYWKDTSRMQNEAVQAAKDAKESAAIVAEIKHSFDEFKSQKVTLAFKDVFNVANKLIAKVSSENSIHYRDREIVMKNSEGNYIDLGMACGSEFAAVYAGVCMGLSKDSRILVMDELSRFDKKVKGRILKAISELLNDGQIDQFIGADCRIPTAIEECNIIRL